MNPMSAASSSKSGPNSPRHLEDVLGITPTVTQHFVPRGYLRAFERDRRRIRVYDLSSDRQFEASSKSIAAEVRYYDIPLDANALADIPEETRTVLQGAAVSTEGWLSRIESQGIRVVRRLVESPEAVRELSLREQYVLARFVAAMFFRGPKFRRDAHNQREWIVRVVREFKESWARGSFPRDKAEELVAAWKDLPDHEVLREDRPHEITRLVAWMFQQTQGWANLFCSMDWDVQVSQRGGVPKLYVSDSPLARRLPAVRGDWRHGALTDFGYWLPLAPHVLLRMRPWPQELPGVGHTGARSHSVLSPWSAAQANMVQSTGAVQYVYGDGGVFTREEAEDALRNFDLASECVALALGWNPRAHFLPLGASAESLAGLLSVVRLEEENRPLLEILGRSSGMAS